MTASREFLSILRQHKLLAKGSKCEVGQSEVYFLGQYSTYRRVRFEWTTLYLRQCENGQRQRLSKIFRNFYD